MGKSLPPTNRPEVTVLVIDDDASILDMLSSSLKYQGFTVHTALDGGSALRVVQRVRPDIIVLEVGLPGVGGFGVLRRLRADGIDAPVVFLTTRAALQDKITGLSVGADDYITKPFSVQEVATRLRVVLRRSGTRTRGSGAESESPDGRRLSFADLELDEDTREVSRAGRPVALSPMEFKLLRYFMTNPNRVLTKPMILGHVWPYDFTGDPGVVETYVSYLRRKTHPENAPLLLHTLRGVGYVLRMPR